MKLLLDQNLSFKMVKDLQKHFPISKQVGQIGMAEATDIAIWKFAQKNEFTIITKDSDFEELSVIQGCPPKVIWLQIGNITTSETLQKIIENQEAIHELLSGNASCLEISE